MQDVDKYIRQVEQSLGELGRLDSRSASIKYDDRDRYWTASVTLPDGQTIEVRDEDLLRSVQLLAKRAQTKVS